MLAFNEVGTADFYFINPAGILFGPGARVNVPAAFHDGTADELGLTNLSDDRLIARLRPAKVRAYFGDLWTDTI